MILSAGSLKLAARSLVAFRRVSCSSLRAIAEVFASAMILLWYNWLFFGEF